MDAETRAHLFANHALQSEEDMLGLLPSPAYAAAKLLRRHQEQSPVLVTADQTAAQACLKMANLPGREVGVVLDGTEKSRGLRPDFAVVYQPARIDDLWFRELYAPATMTGTQFILAASTTRSQERTALDVAVSSGQFELFCEPALN